MTSSVVVTMNNGIATVMLNRPDAFNALDLEMGFVEDPLGEHFYAYPSLAVNARDDALIGFARFSPNEYASGAYALRAASDPAGLTRSDAILRAGQAPYVKLGAGGRNRWGDYSDLTVELMTAIWCK